MLKLNAAFNKKIPVAGAVVVLFGVLYWIDSRRRRRSLFH